MPARRDDIPEGNDLAAMLKDGATFLELANRYDCTPSTIAKRVDKYRADAGLPTGKETRAPRARFDLNDEPWKDDALCAQTDPEAFFPEKGGSTREGKAVCRRCTVSAECLDSALDHEERFGIWGGLSERERRSLLKKRSARQEKTT